MLRTGVEQPNGTGAMLSRSLLQQDGKAKICVGWRRADRKIEKGERKEGLTAEKWHERQARTSLVGGLDEKRLERGHIMRNRIR